MNGHNTRTAREPALMSAICKAHRVGILQHTSRHMKVAFEASNQACRMLSVM